MMYMDALARTPPPPIQTQGAPPEGIEKPTTTTSKDMEKEANPNFTPKSNKKMPKESEMLPRKKAQQ